MCELPAPADMAARPGSRRRKLWEIKTSCHCLVCGTCLTIAELRKIGAKARLQIPEDATDYEIHSHFVHCAESPGPVAKLIHKALDRKYRAAVEHCRRYKSGSSLTDYWSRSLAKGEIPGPFWAVMTHPLTPDALALRVFGDVHMLSHLEGSSNRADMRRLGALEAENAKLSRSLAEETAAAQRRLAAREREIQALTCQVQDIEATKLRLTAAEDKLAAYESGAQVSELEGRIKLLETAAALASQKAESAEALLEQRTEAHQALQQEADALAASHAAIESECEALAALVEEGRNGHDRRPASLCPFDLSGQCIVYVGGRTGLTSHFRALVEDSNGRFIHHDGGLEESERRLSHLLSKGDVVLCPIDCVSHRACIRAKHFCKRTARTFIPLRSSGLSSFVSGLRQVASSPPSRPS